MEGSQASGIFPQPHWLPKDNQAERRKSDICDLANLQKCSEEGAPTVSVCPGEGVSRDVDLPVLKQCSAEQTTEGKPVLWQSVA